MSKKKNFQDKAKGILNDVKDDTKSFAQKDMEDGKGMAILGYIFPPIPYFVEKKNKFVKYHATQGMNLFVIGIAYSIIYAILTSVIKVKGDCGFGYWGDLAGELGYKCSYTPWWVTWPLGLIGVCITIIAIIGIVNVCKGKAKELPIVNKVKLFK